MAAADKSLNLHVATTSDASGLTQASTSLSGVDSAAEATTATFNRLGVEAQKVAVAMQGEAVASQQAAAGAAALDAAMEKTRGAMAATTSVTQATVSVTQQTAPALDEVAKAQRRVKEANESATKTTSNFGYAMMEAAYAADDLQYGFKGIVNNIPQILLGLGLGGGLTGVISILAVGINILGEKMGWWGGKAVATAEDLGKLVNETRNAATAAKQQEISINAGEAALKRYSDAIKGAKEKYDDLAAATDRATRAKERLDRANLSVDEAKASLDLAKVEEKRAGGKITDIDAEKQSTAIKAGIAQKKFEVAQRAAAREIADLQAKASAKEQESRTILERANDREAGGSGLLDVEGRKRLEAELKNSEETLKKYRQELKEMPETIVAGRSTVPNGMGLILPSVEQNPRIPRKEAEIMEESRRHQALLRQQDADKAAQNRTGSADADALRQDVEDKREVSEKGLQESHVMLDEAAVRQQEKKAAEKAFSYTSQATDQSAVNRVNAMEQAAAEKEAAEREKERQAKLPKGTKDLGVGEFLLSDIASKSGVPPEALNSLSEAIRGAESGSGTMSKQLNDLLKNLSQFLVRSHQENSKTSGLIKELQEQVKELRYGR